MSQLAAQSIKALCVGTNTPLIVPFSAERLVISGKSAGLSASSYDCRIDHDLILGVHPGKLIAEHILACKPLVDLRTGCADEELFQALVRNPSPQALAYTLEDFTMTDNVSAKVANKSTYARLFMRVDNTFIDPGFIGNLTLELANHGDEPIILRKGDPICQILFEWLDQPTDRPYSGKYNHQTKAAHPARFEQVV